MAARKGEETLLRRGTMRKVGREQTLDHGRNVLRLHVAIDLAPERGVRSKPAAGEHVIAFDGRGVFAGLDLASEEPDVADVVLRTGVMTAGEMDVHRTIEFDAALAPAGNLLGMPLRIGGGEFAA